MRTHELTGVVEKKEPQPGSLSSARKEILLGVTNKKVRVLQDKASFFEGQLNPLYHENLLLKEQIIAMNRMITRTSVGYTVKTEELRKLLTPVERSGRNRQLEIETASMEEICEMIKQDWWQLVDDNRKLLEELEQTREKLRESQAQTAARNKKYVEDLQRLVRQLDDLSDKHERSLREFEVQKEQLEAKWRQQLRLKEKELAAKQFEVEQARRNIRSLESELERMTTQHESQVRRLKDELSGLAGQFEEAKRNMQVLFEKQLKERLEELTHQFQEVLKSKDEQISRLALELEEREQEFKRRLTQKNDAISKLNLAVSELNRELGSARAEMSDLRTQVQRLQSVEADLRKSVELADQQRIQLEATLREKQALIEDHLRQIESLTSANTQLKWQHAELEKKMERQLKDAQYRLEREKRLLEDQISYLKAEQEQQARLLSNKLKDLQKDWQERHDQLEREKAALNQKLDKCEGLLRERQDEMRAAARKHAEELEEERRKASGGIAALREQEERKRRQMEEAFNRKLETLVFQNEQKLSELRKELDDQKLSFEQMLQKAQEERKAMEEEMETRLKSIRKQLQDQQKEFEEAMLKEKAAMQKRIREMEEAHQQQMEERERKHKEAMKRLNEEMEEERAKAEAKIKRLAAENERAAELMKREFEKKLKDLANEFESQIKQLKSLNATDELERKHKEQLERLMKEAEVERQRITKHLEQLANQQKVAYEEMLSKLKQEHESEIVSITKKLEGDVAYLNDLLLSEKEEHVMTKMTKEEKIAYLTQKITEFRQRMADMEQENSRLNLALLQKSQELRDLEQQFEERVKQKAREFEEIQVLREKEFEQKLLQKNQECEMRIKEKIQENIQFSADLHQEFMLLQRTHKEQIEGMQAKFDELEKLFLERPSRPEDLSAIKDLLEEKEDMARIVEAAELKVKHANEIVKYLQMELENYKQAYDIFGPNENTAEMRERLSLKRLSPQQKELSNSEASNSKDSSLIQSPIKRSFRIRPIQTEMDDPGAKFNTQEIYEEEQFEPVGQTTKVRHRPSLPPLKPQPESIEQRDVDISEEVVQNAERFLSRLRNQPLQLLSPSSPSQAYRSKKGARASSTRKSRIRKYSSNQTSVLQMLSRNYQRQRLNTHVE